MSIDGLNFKKLDQKVEKLYSVSGAAESYTTNNAASIFSNNVEPNNSSTKNLAEIENSYINAEKSTLNDDISQQILQEHHDEWISHLKQMLQKHGRDIFTNAKEFIKKIQEPFIKKYAANYLQNNSSTQEVDVKKILQEHQKEWRAHIKKMIDKHGRRILTPAKKFEKEVQEPFIQKILEKESSKTQAQTE